MKRGLIFLILSLLSIVLVACGGEKSGASGSLEEPTGPALVMFYTDN